MEELVYYNTFFGTSRHPVVKLSEAIDNDTKRFDGFTKVQWISFPDGGVLRVPYSIAGSWWYGLRDTLGL